LIWLAWRRHRGQLIAWALGLAVVAGLLVLTGRGMQHAFEADGLGPCLRALNEAPTIGTEGDAGCAALGAAFAARFFDLRLLGLIAFAVMPLLFGMFWGAPLVARELEEGTAAFVWTQGITRVRWAVASFATVSAAAVVLVAPYAALVTWWYGPLNAATGERFQWLIFDQQGLVPIGYALFAVALGALAGTATGRTLRAMGITVVGFLLVRLGVAVGIRPHLQPAMERTYPVVGTSQPNRLLGDWLVGGGGPGVGAVYDAMDHRLKGGQMLCAPSEAQVCIREVGRGAYNRELFQPAERFWTFQAIELAIFVGLAVGAFLLATWWIGRRPA
jgi:hypothetical protein